MSTEALNKRVVKLASCRKFSLSGDVRDMSEAHLLWCIAREVPDPRAWLERFKAMSGVEQEAESLRLWPTMHSETAGNRSPRAADP